MLGGTATHTLLCPAAPPVPTGSDAEVASSAQGKKNVVCQRVCGDQRATANGDPGKCCCICAWHPRKPQCGHRSSSSPAWRGCHWSVSVALWGLSVPGTGCLHLVSGVSTASHHQQSTFVGVPEAKKPFPPWAAWVLLRPVSEQLPGK